LQAEDRWRRHAGRASLVAAAQGWQPLGWCGLHIQLAAGPHPSLPGVVRVVRVRVGSVRAMAPDTALVLGAVHGRSARKATAIVS
jgi:hypothetical protein